MLQNPPVLAMYDPYSSEYVPHIESDASEASSNRRSGFPSGMGNIPPPPVPKVSPKKRIPLGGTSRGLSPAPHGSAIGSSSSSSGDRRSLSCSRTVHAESSSTNGFTNGKSSDVASSSSSGKSSSAMGLFRSNSASRDNRSKDPSNFNFNADRTPGIRGPSGISDRPGPGSRSGNMGPDTPPISPLQAVSIRPSFSRLGIAGGAYQSTQGTVPPSLSTLRNVCSVSQPAR